jgi:hypothetical protein
MASAKKILASMRRNARNWRIEDLQTLAKHYGIAYRQNGTSHVFFTFDPGYLPVPAHRPIKPVYVQQFVELLDAKLAARKDTEG